MVPCEYFGGCDGMDGGCWWCMEMMPYRWHMCQDEKWIRGLTSRGKMSREEAINFIEEYKQKHPLGDERRALMTDEEWERMKAYVKRPQIKSQRYKTYTTIDWRKDANQAERL